VDSSIFDPRDAQLSADHVVGRRRKQLFCLESGLLFSIGGWRSGAGVGCCVGSIGGMGGVRRAAARRDQAPKRFQSIGGGGGQPNEGGASHESFETPRGSGIDRVIAEGKPRMREREESSPRLTRRRAQSSIEEHNSSFVPQGVVWIW